MPEALDWRDKVGTLEGGLWLRDLVIGVRAPEPAGLLVFETTIPAARAASRIAMVRGDCGGVRCGVDAVEESLRLPSFFT